MDSVFTAFDFRLRDGRVLQMRATRPADEAALLQAFDRLSPEARYTRFMRAVGAPNVERLRKLLASLPEIGLGILAVCGETDIAGSALFLIGKDPTVCEFATTVAGGYAGLGLGRALMTALIGAAKRRGLLEMEGYVLASNQPMLRLASRLGFTIARDPDDPSVLICRLRLDDIRQPQQTS